MRLAVLDLGTNVFNLLIADVSGEGCDIKKVVKTGSHIGKGGFKRGELTREAIQSSLEALDKMKLEIEQIGGVHFVKAFATSAVRDSSNGVLFVEQIRDRYGFDAEIISGDREAELIYKGIRESLLIYNEKVLMLDIGGGSNEFIIADRERIYWKESFPLGVIRMKELLSPSDPISDDDIDRYVKHLDKILDPLFANAAIYKPSLLIGSSGSFDTLRELIFPNDNGVLPAMELPLNRFFELHSKLLKSTVKERFEMAGMSPLRAEYMVLGSIFVNYIISRLGVKELYQSAYSLKEGYMAEVAEELKMKNSKL